MKTIEWKKFNVNSKVKIKLTPYGIEKIKSFYKSWSDEEVKEYIEHATDEEGYYEVQMWEFMMVLGPHINPCHTCEISFESEILINDEDLK